MDWNIGTYVGNIKILPFYAKFWVHAIIFHQGLQKMNKNISTYHLEQNFHRFRQKVVTCPQSMD